MPTALRARRGPLVGVALVLLAFVAIELGWVLLVRVGRPGDEYSHLHYVERIAFHHQLPGATQPEKQQPPLYYVLGALVETAGGGPHAVRILSVVLTVLALAAVGATAALALPRHRWAPVVAMAMVGLLPDVEAVGAAVSDDSLATLSGALLLLVSVAALRGPPPGLRLVAAAGLAIGVGLLSKETDWPLLALPLGAVLWASTPGRRLAHAAVLAVIPVATAGWWFARNLVAFRALTPPLGPLSTGPNLRLRSLGLVRSAMSLTLRSLFGPTDATGGVLPRAEVAILLMAVLGAVIVGALVAALIRLARRWPRLPRGDRAVALALGAAASLALLASIANSVLITLEPQARYLLVAVAAPATAVAALLGGVRESRLAVAGRALATVAGLALVALAVDSLRLAAAQP